MPHDYHALAQEWFRKADEDWDTASLIMSERAYPSVVCFHAHQAAEKYLKGVLVWHGKDIKDEFKTHNLLKLFEYAQQLIPTLPCEIHDNCLLLNRYYTWARYPSDIEEYGWEEAGAAENAAFRIRNTIRDVLGLR